MATANPEAQDQQQPKTAGITTAETMAVAACMLVNFVDQMGPQFTAPVLVPYGRWLGADLKMISIFGTARGGAAILSSLWMPLLSDRLGRKPVALMSVIGCAIGFAVQGCACRFLTQDEDNLLPSIVMIIGRFTTGFFSGMQPVLRALITELSTPDQNLMKKRLVLMSIATQVAGIALSPIAGWLATFGLELPFYICAGVGVVAIFMVIGFFKEASDVKGTARVSQPTPIEQQGASGAAASASTHEGRDAALMDPMDTESESFLLRQKMIDAKKREGSPWYDKVLFTLFAAYFCVFILQLAGPMFLAPVLFKHPSFNITGENEEVLEANIAYAIGLTSIPSGSCMVICAAFLFVPLTNRFGDLPVISLAGLGVTFLYPFYGFFVDRVWKAAIVNGLIGCCFGFIGPAISPLTARYSSKVYPSQAAAAQSVPLLGLRLSETIGPNVMAAIAGDGTDLRIAFCFSGGVAFLFVLLFLIGDRMAGKHLVPSTMANQQQKVC